jgi:D-arabinose 5-phosphate isomerase GutQ
VLPFKDILIVISGSGEPRMSLAADAAKRLAKVVGITTNQKSTLGEITDVTIDIQSKTNVAWKLYIPVLKGTI